MKKLGKKELEIVVGEVSSEICKVRKEKLVEKFESSEEGKRMRELEKLINDGLVEINEKMRELKEKKKIFESRELLGESSWGFLDLEVESGKFKSWEVEIKVGRDYESGYSNVRRSIDNKVEKELILEGLKGEFDLNELIKSMIEKFS
jgi:hypothetical protein